MSELSLERFTHHCIPQFKSEKEWTKIISSCGGGGGLGWGQWGGGWLAGRKEQEKECYFGSFCKDLWENRTGLTALL